MIYRGFFVLFIYIFLSGCNWITPSSIFIKNNSVAELRSISVDFVDKVVNIESLQPGSSSSVEHRPRMEGVVSISFKQNGNIKEKDLQYSTGGMPISCIVDIKDNVIESSCT